MKKLIISLLTLCMVMTMLTGCGTSVSKVLDDYEEYLKGINYDIDAYSLIYIDDNNVPELCAEIIPDGVMILYYKDGEVHSKTFNYMEFDYIEKEGLIREQCYAMNDNGYGFNDSHIKDYVWRFSEGEFEVVFSGDIKKIFVDGWYSHSLININGKGEVSQDEYDEILESIFDKHKGNFSEVDSYCYYEELRENS